MICGNCGMNLDQLRPDDVHSAAFHNDGRCKDLQTAFPDKVFTPNKPKRHTYRECLLIVLSCLFGSFCVVTLFSLALMTAALESGLKWCCATLDRLCP